MANPKNKEKLLIQVLRKIPIFKGLSPSQVKKILGLCNHQQYGPGDHVCESGTRPDEMYVLLSGELGIITPGGLKVATILPVTTVGEMGVITGQPRVATVEVTKPSALFTIQKPRFDALLRDDGDMEAKVYRAIIDVMSAKLSNDNVRLRDAQVERRRYEGRIAVLERRLKAQEQRTEAALELGAEKSGLDREVLALAVGEQVEDLVPRILVVDDEIEFRKLVVDALPAFEVVEAENGHQALEIVQAQTLDLVITDIKMPEMDGIQLLGSLRGQFPSLKVLGASGYLDRTELEGHAFDGIVEKPLSLEPFQQLVEQTAADRG
jgi:CheY-like chemotaxis protein